MVNICIVRWVSDSTCNILQDLKHVSYLVGGFNHLEKYESVMKNDNPTYEMENKIHVPNHQPVIYVYNVVN